MPKLYFVGVDVGTTSARAALVTSTGELVKKHEKKIQIWNVQPDHYEQSSEDIWKSVCECVKTVVEGTPVEEIVAISFDATCSLVVLDEANQPLTVSTTGNNEQNVILWMDHRASVEANHINSTKHELLRYVGGNVSLEMQMPKLLWLKKNLKLSCWSKIHKVFDLPDFLTFRATDCDTRSMCSVVCKWNYDAENNEWSKDFLDQIDLKELYENNFEKIGQKICEPGAPVGKGLTEMVANSMGLLLGTVVSTSLIDAHAGALGTFGLKTIVSTSIENKMALICGTSTCHMSLTKEPCWLAGIWGPYKNALIPGYYLNEAGQSAAGELINHILQTHPASKEIEKKLDKDQYITNYLNNLLEDMATKNNLGNVAYLTNHLHVWPDFHGNRSPLADPKLKGMISGLGMSTDEESLAILYLATIQSLAYGTKHIIEKILKSGRPDLNVLLFCGGLAKNKLYVTTHVDACKIQGIIPNEEEMVLIGCAMLGASAAKVFPDLQSASMAMGGSGIFIDPNSNTIKYHQRKYQVFLSMLEHQRMYKTIMEKPHHRTSSVYF